MKKVKETQFEINLYPVISLLSVLICFLLLTSVWVQIGEIEIQSGALKENSTETMAYKSTPRLLITSVGLNKYRFEVEGLSSKFSRLYKIKNLNQNKFIITKLKQIKNKFSSIDLVMIRPNLSSNYQKVINLIDLIKQGPFKKIGIETI